MSLNTHRLTTRQKLFVKYVTAPDTPSAAEAARRAGYQGSNRVLAISASRLLSSDSIQEAVSAEESRTQLASDISKADIIARLVAIADDNSSGSNTNARVNALALIAKMQGMIVARQEIRGQIHHKVEPLTTYSVDELRSMLGRATPREIDGTAPMTIDASVVLKTDEASPEEN